MRWLVGGCSKFKAQSRESGVDPCFRFKSFVPLRCTGAGVRRLNLLWDTIPRHTSIRTRVLSFAIFFSRILRSRFLSKSIPIDSILWWPESRLFTLLRSNSHMAVDNLRNNPLKPARNACSKYYIIRIYTL